MIHFYHYRAVHILDQELIDAVKLVCNKEGWKLSTEDSNRLTYSLSLTLLSWGCDVEIVVDCDLLFITVKGATIQLADGGYGHKIIKTIVMGVHALDR